MLSERRITMEAIDRSRNVFRSWRCEIERDLFGVMLVSVTFGRTGTQGRTIRRVVHDESAAMGVGATITCAAGDRRKAVRRWLSGDRVCGLRSHGVGSRTRSRLRQPPQ